jgi:hypothetical protein
MALADIFGRSYGYQTMKFAGALRRPPVAIVRMATGMRVEGFTDGGLQPPNERRRRSRATDRRKDARTEAQKVTWGGLRGGGARARWCVSPGAVVLQPGLDARCSGVGTTT